jgi:hypothetical protein
MQIPQSIQSKVRLLNQSLFVIVLLGVFATFSCKKTTTEPEEKEEVVTEATFSWFTNSGSSFVSASLLWYDNGFSGSLMLNNSNSVLLRMNDADATGASFTVTVIGYFTTNELTLELTNAGAGIYQQAFGVSSAGPFPKITTNRMFHDPFSGTTNSIKVIYYEASPAATKTNTIFYFFST